MQPTLYLLVGYPGAGKTTVAQTLHQLTGAVHIWADEERRKRFDSQAYNAAHSQQLYDELNKETESLLAAGKSVVFDTNFNFRKDREHLRQLATAHHAKTVLIWITTPQDLAKQRATADTQNNQLRVFGNMSQADFDRIAARLEEPQADEQPIMLDGSQVDTEQIRSALVQS